MGGSTKSGRKREESSLADPETDVEALLRAAQDDLLLKLHVDSHSISSRPSPSFCASSAALQPDLVRRLEALKSPPPPSVAPPPPPPPSQRTEKGAAAAAVAAAEGGDDKWGRILGADLAARFAALKGSSSGHNPGFRHPDLMPDLGDSGDEAGADGDDGVSEKEVEKVMQWAMDAARLDPSKRDKDDDAVDVVNSDDDDEEEEEEEDLNEKKRKQMNKGKPKKWFFF